MRRVLVDGRERAAVAVVRGSAGVGKSWLVDRALKLEVTAPGTVILRMSGHPAETDLPYAGLHQLLLPLMAELPHLPAPQQRALEQALARSPPGPPHRFAVAAGLHGLLTTIAERHPVVVVVEDAQWLDSSTMTCLVFVMRRLDIDPVTVILTSRDPALAGLDATDIELHPLDPQAAQTIVLDAHPDLAPAVANEIIRVAAGLPVVLREAPADLTAAQRSGAAPLPSVLPIGSTLSWLYRQRLSKIGVDGRMALVVMSLERLEAPLLEAALATLGIGIDTLEAAEHHGLVERCDGGHVLAHATVATAIRASVDPRVIARARTAIASALIDQPHRQVWFLDPSVPGGDAELASRWSAAAADAEDRGAWAEAATAHEHAARDNSADRGERRARMFAAVDAHARAGAAPHQLRLLAELAADADDHDERLLIEARRITARTWAGPNHIDPLAVDTLIAAHPLASSRTRAALRSTVALAALVGGDHPTALAATDAALGELVADESQIADRLLHDLIKILSGRVDAGATLRSTWLDQLTDGDVLEPSGAMFLAAYVLMLIDDLDGSTRVAQRLGAAATRFGDLSQLGLSTALVAAVEQRRGDMLAARAHYTAGIQLCLDTDLIAPTAHLRLRHGHLLASLGQETSCRSMIADCVATGETNLAIRHGAAWTLGLLELTLGDCAAAVAHLRDAEALLEVMGLGEPGYSSQAGDLIEALWRLRRPAEADAVLRRYQAAADRLQRHSALAIAARCRGLLAAPDALDAHFETAHRHHTCAPDRFQQARTDLLWGMQRRRARRKSDARSPLRDALRAFEAMGATPWAAQAAAELTACGERRRTAWAALDELTPRELEVAIIVADGASNPAAAAALCISVRTVEDHLTRIYRKLAITGRTSLRAALARPDTSGQPPSMPANT